MIQYVNNVFLPFVEQTQVLRGEDKPAVVIKDNFNGQVTDAVTKLLDSHRVHTCLVPPNTNDRLQPMEISVNRPAKAWLKRLWYSDQITEQLKLANDMETANLEPVNLSMARVKEISADWIVHMVDSLDYINQNPQFTVNVLGIGW